MAIGLESELVHFLVQQLTISQHTLCQTHILLYAGFFAFVEVALDLQTNVLLDRNVLVSVM